MDLSTRYALVSRLFSYFPEGAPIPQKWDEIPLTTQLRITTGDPEAAAVFKGVMPSELEAQVMEGKWSSEPVAPIDERAEYERKIQEALSTLQVKGIETLSAETAARLQDQRTAQLNSLQMGAWN